MKNVLFYKYVKIEDPKQFKDEHLALCKSLNLLGKVLISNEGINGCVSGKKEEINQYKKELVKNYPVPNYTGIDLEKYDSKILPIVGSKGCKRRCVFCDEYQYQHLVLISSFY